MKELYPRWQKATIKKMMLERRVLLLNGPRQSGKTTLARYIFPRHRYLSLENLDLRHFAKDDPRGFLLDSGNNIIIDEIQRVPELFSYLQEHVDLEDIPAQYVLTGSQQFLLMEKISQSLAGRIVTFKLYPFSVSELFQSRPDKTIKSIWLNFNIMSPISNQVFLKTMVTSPT